MVVVILILAGGIGLVIEGINSGQPATVIAGALLLAFLVAPVLLTGTTVLTMTTIMAKPSAIAPGVSNSDRIGPEWTTCRWSAIRRRTSSTP